MDNSKTFNQNAVQGDQAYKEVRNGVSMSYRYLNPWKGWEVLLAEKQHSGNKPG